MQRTHWAWTRAVDELGVLAHLHLAALVGLLAALASEVANTDGIQKALVGFVVTVVVRQLGDLAGRRGRAICLERAAVNARAILDRKVSVSLTKDFDHGPNKILVLRDLASLDSGADLGAQVWGYADLEAIAKHAADSRSGLLTELATCYPALRSKTQRKIDAFTEALSDVTVYALAVRWNNEPDEPTRYDELLAKLKDAVHVGDALDELGDPRGAEAARSRRTQAAASAAAKEHAAARILTTNAREAVAPLVGATAATLLDELRSAADRTRHVDGDAFRDAREDVRAAHRAVTERLARAIELGQNLEREPNDERVHEFSDAVDQIPTTLAALERIGTSSSVRGI